MTDDDSKPPMVFLSHASEDKDSFTEPLGRELARLGIMPWLDKWELQPGDSLTKIFAGIGQCDAVVFVASSFSVDKPWVREELDSAVVRRIEDQNMRLIPVRLDGVAMPAPVGHLRWLNTERTPEGIQKVAKEIADLLHGHDLRPTVGAKPTYTATPLALPGLTQSDAFLLAESIRIALELDDHGPLFLNWNMVKQRAEQAGLSGDALLESLHVLAEGDMVDARIMSVDYVPEYEVTTFGYRLGIGAIIPDIEDIERRIVAEIVNDPPTSIHVVNDLAQRVGAPWIVVDQWLRALDARGLLSISHSAGDATRLHSVSPTLRRLLDS